MARLDTLTALDIGSSKVVCLIAELGGEGELEIIARGVAPCRGVSQGALVDAEETARAIDGAVTEAEKRAGHTVGPALVSLSSKYLCTRSSLGLWPIGAAGGEVSREDVRRALESAHRVGLPSSQQIVHAVPRGFRVDGQGGIRNPLGLHGTRLEVEALILAGASPFLQNLRKVLQRAEVEVDPEGMVASSIASSLAVLTEEERALGTAMIDIGMGTMDLAIYEGGEIGHAAVLPLGGELLVMDVARYFRIPLAEAERIVVTAGMASPEFVEEPERGAAMLEAPAISGDGVVSLSRREVAEVLEARLADGFEWAARQIEEARARQGLTVTSLVLTGGVSLLPGMALLAHRELQVPVRVAAPCYPPDLHQELDSPLYSTAVGLLLYGATRLQRPEPVSAEGGALRRWAARIHAMLNQIF